MSDQYGKLCSLIFKDIYGEDAEKVAMCLFYNGPKTLAQISLKTELQPLSKVKKIVLGLMKHNLVSYIPSLVPNKPAYRLFSDRLTSIQRYIRCAPLVKEKFGVAGEILLEILMSEGQATASNLIAQSAIRFSNTQTDMTAGTAVVTMRDQMLALASDRFIQRCLFTRDSNETAVPNLEVSESTLYTIPESLNIPQLTAKVEAGVHSVNDQEDKAILWRVNLDRLNQELRDKLLVDAISNRVDATAGQLMQVILNTMYKNCDPWAVSSNVITLIEIRSAVKACHPELLTYLEKYLKTIVEDSSGFMSRFGDSGQGEYYVNTKAAIIELTWSTIESLILERFGSHALRIFRVVRLKKFMEQDQIQVEAMIPAKEAKLVTYKLMHENWIQQKELRGPANSRDAKGAFLLYIDLNQIARKTLEMCYKCQYNAITRREHELTEQSRLIDKHQRIQSVIENLKMQGASESQIEEVSEMITPAEEATLKRVECIANYLNSAEFLSDNTSFIMLLYLQFASSK